MTGTGFMGGAEQADKGGSARARASADSSTRARGT